MNIKFHHMFCININFNIKYTISIELSITVHCTVKYNNLALQSSTFLATPIASFTILRSNAESYEDEIRPLSYK